MCAEVAHSQVSQEFVFVTPVRHTWELNVCCSLPRGGINIEWSKSYLRTVPVVSMTTSSNAVSRLKRHDHPTVITHRPYVLKLRGSFNRERIPANVQRGASTDLEGGGLWALTDHALVNFEVSARLSQEQYAKHHIVESV